MRKAQAPSRVAARSGEDVRPSGHHATLPRLTALSLALLAAPLALAQDCALPSGPLPTEARTVFLLDRSASMEGAQGGPANIFGGVKNATLRAVSGQRLPGRVEVASFDAGLRDVQDFRWPEDAAGLQGTLTALKADGRSTWLYRSLEELLTGLRRRPESATTIYVLTDGRDNENESRYSLQRALSAFDRKRGAFDRLYYVALGTTIPPEAKAALDRSGFAYGLELPAGQVPDLTASGPVLPALIEVGPGTTPLAAGTYSLDARSADAAGAKLALDGSVLSLSAAGGLPQDATALLCRAGAASGPQTALLRLRGGADVAAAPTPSAVGTSTAGPGLTLLSNVGGELRLKPGGSLTLGYQLGGPATQSATLSFPALPAGVRADLNGVDAAQGLSLHGGERATLTLREAGATGSSLNVVPQVNGVNADSASVMVMLGQAGTSSAASSPDLKLLNPGASGSLKPGQSVTWRYRVEGGPATIQALRSPAGTRASLSGAVIGKPIPTGGEFAVSIVNEHLQTSGTAPQVQLTSGRAVDLPVVQPASLSRGGSWWWLLVLLVLGGLLAWWLTRRRTSEAAGPATLTRPRGLSVEGDQLVVHFDGGARHGVTVGPELVDLGAALKLPDLDGLKLERGEAGTRLVGLPPGLRLTERGRTLAMGDLLSPDLIYAFASGVAAADYRPGVVPMPPVAPVPPVHVPEPTVPAAPIPETAPAEPVLEPVHDTTIVVEPSPEALPSVGGLVVDEHFGPATLPPVEAAPAMAEPEATLPAAPEVVAEAAPVAPPEPSVPSVVIAPLPQPVTQESPADFPPSRSADFGQLSQDIASLGILGGVGGLGVPRELLLEGDSLVLRGDEDEEPQELPDGPTDLGEAFGIPAMQGFSVERAGHVVRLTHLPPGFQLRADEVALGTGAVLPFGRLHIEVPPSLRATVERVREALGQEVDTRDSGVDLSDIESAINLDSLFGDFGGMDDGRKH